MNRENKKMKKIWKAAAIAALGVLAVGTGAVGTLRVKASETTAINQASVTIGDTTTEYATAEEAFDSLENDGADRATVTFLTDVTLTGDFFKTPKDEVTTVDLNGKSVTVDYFSFYGKDVVQDGSEAGTGSVYGYLYAEEGAALTVKSGHFYGRYSLYLYPNTTTVVAGGSFYAANDVLMEEGADLTLKNAEFPAVNGENGGFDFSEPSGTKTYADILDVSAAYYKGEEKVTDVAALADNEVTSIKQQYVATYEQEGKETVYITDGASINDAIFSDGDFSSVDNSLSTKLTLYADMVGTSRTQKLSNFTIDLNGNVMTNATHRVYTALHLTDSSAAQTGLLDACTFILNEWNEVDTEVNMTLGCNTYKAYIEVYQHGKFTVTGGRHYGYFNVRSDSEASDAQVYLHGGIYEDVFVGVYEFETAKLSIKDIAFKPASEDASWGFRGEEGFHLGDALADGYMLQYADGSYETDLTNTDIYGAFTVAPHEHGYAKQYTDEKHWEECGCGLVKEGSESAHGNADGVLSKDETGHWYPCDGCGYHISHEGHNYEAVKDTHTEENGYDEHKTACTVCGYESVEGCTLNEVGDQPPTETAVGYRSYECVCGYTEQEAYCEHLGGYSYLKVGSAEDETHKYVCKIEKCGKEWTEDCSVNLKETVYPTAVKDGYNVYACDCGYTYNETTEELESFGDKVLATIGGLPMTINGNSYYVNGANGAVGTVHSEAPATYHARLTWDTGEDGAYYIVLELNGLNISVTDGAALLLTTDVTVFVKGENTVAATYAENGSVAININGYAEIVGDKTGGTLNVTVDTTAEATSAFALYTEGPLDIYDVTLNVDNGAPIGGAIYASQLCIDSAEVNVTACSNAVSAYYIDLQWSVLNVNLKNESLSAVAIYADAISGSNATVNVSAAFDEGTVSGIVANGYLTVTLTDINVQMTALTPKTEETDETEETAASRATAVEGGELEFEHSNVNVQIYGVTDAYGLKARGNTYVESSTLSVDIENDGGYASGICVTTENEETAYGLRALDSEMNVTIAGEGMIVCAIEVTYASDYDGGYAVRLENSTVNVDTGEAIATTNVGVRVTLAENGEGDFADAYGLYVKNSRMSVYYGAGMMASGIAVRYKAYDDSESQREALYVKNSVILSQNRVTSDQDEAQSEEWVQIANYAIGVSAYFEDSNKERLITLDRSTVTAIAGEGMVSLGLFVMLEEECCGSYIDEVVYAEECRLTFIGGDSEAMSAGVMLNASDDAEGDFGIKLIDCETLAISGTASYRENESEIIYGATVAMCLTMDTDDELLYLEGGRTVLIAPDTYEVEEDGEIVTYNKNSYAMGLEGDDAEIVSGTLEMWAGTYCVQGDLDTKNDVEAMSGMTYGDDALDGRFESDIRFSEGNEEDTPKYVFLGESNVYIGGVAMSEGQYYVNGKRGAAGEVYNREPENWNAKLETVYDAEEDRTKYVLTLNGLYLAAEEDSLLFAQILCFGDMDIVLVDGSENVIEANVLAEEYATLRTASAIDARTWTEGEYYDEEDDDTYDIDVLNKGGVITVSGGGELTLVGSANGVTHDGKLYVTMDSYLENGVYTVKDLEKTVEATAESWTVKAHAHIVGDWIVEKAATCTEAGSQYKKCTDCGDVVETATIDATGHAYGEWIIVEEATKEAAGLREKSCANCGDKITEFIPEEKELSDGAIVAITLGSSVAGCSGIAVGLWFILKKKLLGV